MAGLDTKIISRAVRSNNSPRGLHEKWYTTNVPLFCTPEYYSEKFISAQSCGIMNFNIESDSTFDFSIIEQVQWL